MEPRFDDSVSVAYKRKEKIVISGISGVYPKCENIGELAGKLFSQEDLITDMPDVNFSAGKLASVSKFDADFFGITNEHGEYMDPLCRILLEKTYEAIVDAGYNPRELKNSNTAVFVANCTSDAEVESTFRTDVKGALICERAQSFLANRISYCFGLHGPSGTVNTACSSSLYALEFAYKAMKNGECEAAIVGGSNLCLSPGMVRLYKNLGITSARCRSFDDAAIGFCRSEAISVVLLQKEEHARRVYAEVVHVKTNNDGYKKQSILFPSHQMQRKLINEVYQESGVQKCRVAWVEAHGTGTRVGDYQEMKSLETLCDGRQSPLLVGCVKSNLGHTEATSGLCSIAKVIIAMETGLIPPNLHFVKPQNGIEALLQDKIRVITETTPWDGGYVAINNFGIGGANAHLLLKSNARKLTGFNMNPNVPRLVTISGRTSEAVDVVISYLQSNSVNVEFIGLLHKIFSSGVPNHEYRGYLIVDESSSRIRQIKRVKGNKRPVWFIYPGMGSQWTSMAKELLKLEIFTRSILECHSVLETNNVNLLEILTSDDPELLCNIVNCFVGITAVMIALTDTLTSMGVEPDGFIGHSFGEIGCAYADKCLSKKEALMTAYYRGITSAETNSAKGRMAVIGLGGNEVAIRCPESVEVVCRNGSNSCTIAGPVNEVEKLVREFKSENTFANAIYSANIAYHSSYIREFGPVYRQYLEKVIRSPRERSTKWVSSSADAGQWNTTDCKYCSPRYFENNFTNTVLFENALTYIPNNAITIEIAPHSIFKSVLNDTLNSTISNISLMNKHSRELLQHLLVSLGSLYNEGIDMDISRLYSPIPFPVSRGTPMISPLIKWNHDKDWYVPFHTFDPTASPMSSGKPVVVSFDDEEYRYLRDCVIDGRNIFPESGFLKMVWDTVAERNKSPYSDLSVTFINVLFHKTVEIPSKGTLNFDVTIGRFNGYFEVALDETVVTSGYVMTESSLVHEEVDEFNIKEESLLLRASDLYKELRINGYHYGNCFQTLVCSNYEVTAGLIKWTDNWTLYLNSLFQLLYLQESDNLHLCTISQIGSLHINVEKHKEIIKCGKEILFRRSRNHVRSGGVKLIKTVVTRIQRDIYKTPILQTVEFTPYFSPARNVLSVTNVVQLIVTIVLENNLNSKMNVYEFVTPDHELILSKEIDKHFQILSFYKADIKLNTSAVMDMDTSKYPSHFCISSTGSDFRNQKNLHLVILSNSESSREELISAFSTLADSGFILTRERKKGNVINQVEGLEISAVYYLNTEKLVLWHKVSKYDSIGSICVKADSFDWVESLKVLMKQTDKKIILYSEQKYSGIIGFYNCIRKEICGRNVSCFLMLDSKARPFNLNSTFYLNQLKQDLAVNVYKNGCWGCYIPFKMETTFDFSVLGASLQANETTDGIGFRWMQTRTDNNRCPKDDQNCCELIHAYYVTVPHNYADTASFQEDISKNDLTLFEFSGKYKSEKRIMGVSFDGIISTTLSEENCICLDVPEAWSLESAVTVPLAYLTALSLIDRYFDKRKNIILIQDGYSHYGQAMLSVALYYGFTVFTVETDRDRTDYIQLNFPKVTRSFSSQYDSISEELLQKTNNNGVDILVITEFRNCTYELLNSVTKNGKVVYLGSERNARLIIENIIHDGIQFQSMKLKNLIHDSKIYNMKNLFEELIKNGHVKTFEKNITQINLNDKIQSLENAPGHKTILKIRSEDDSSNLELCIKATPKFMCSTDESYIICGGLGGMGFELANWLISRGARNLVLVSRTGRCDGYKTRKISKWRNGGASVVISVDNICSVEGVANLLRKASTMGSVAAVFNTTLVLQDNLFENQTADSFQTVANPKALATILLDKLSRTMCPNLRHFVVFSSIACGYGNAGQANYGFANSVMERICEIRRNEGLPGLAIEWAGVADVGYLENATTSTLPGGTLLQPIRSCLKVLDRFFCDQKSIVTSFVVADNQIVEQSTGSRVFTTIRKIIDKPNSQLNPDSTLRDIGLDSIAIAETKNILEREYNIFMSTEEIFNMKVTDLWGIEKNNKPNFTENESLKKMSVLEEVYTNLFRIMLKTNEILNLKPMVRLPSFLHNGATNEVPTTRERTIFFLPSVEGFSSVMQPLAKNIDLQVLCAQYNLRTTSIKEMTSILLPEIEKRLSPSEPFHLLGYSYGGLLAMEITHALEKKGRTGFLYIVDSSPVIVKWISNVLFKDRGFLTNNLAFVRALKCGVYSKEFENKLIQQNSWESASKFTIDSLPDSVPVKKEHLRILLDTLHKRNNDIAAYDGIPRKSVVSQVFFFRPKDALFDIPAQHALSEVLRWLDLQHTSN